MSMKGDQRFDDGEGWRGAAVSPGGRSACWANIHTPASQQVLVWDQAEPGRLYLQVYNPSMNGGICNKVASKIKTSLLHRLKRHISNVFQFNILYKI